MRHRRKLCDYILRDREDCLRVFLYADEATKEERIREMYGEVLLKERTVSMIWMCGAD